MTNTGGISLRPAARDSRRLALHAAGAIVLLALPCLACVAAAGSATRALLLLALCAVILGPLWFRLLQRELDLFEPLIVANVAFAVMFIARPVADLASGELFHLGYDLEPSFDRALAVALGGTAAFTAGYFCGAGRRLAAIAPTPAQALPRVRAIVIAAVSVLGGVTLFSVFILRAGGFSVLIGLLEGRQAGDNALFLSSTAYFYFGLFTLVPASLLLFAAARQRSSKRLLVAAALSAAVVSVYEAARGDRSGLVPLLALPIFWYVARGKRPRAALLVMVSVAALLASGFMRDVRTVTGRLGEPLVVHAAMADPSREVVNLLRGPDTEMFDALAAELLIVPDTLPFRPGGSIADLGLRAVPRLLWPDKPLEVNDSIVQALWPQHYSVSRAAPALSVLGPFYGDSGWLGLILGMSLLGMAASALREWYRAHSDAAGAQLVYALALPLIVLLMRGTVPDTLGHALFLVVPAVAVAFPLSRHGR